ncbi:GntR family transcriptional regulator [Breznakiella homolactica]|uniref:GntR family transcriptional regulator n=1 Tax=Breznakiella homolactica TaxID=2798577 RepID=A0A7T8BA40_9SPIR|nr:GntR family transcriptional regulator [Breznakiella homolactica]QQO07833.1 GntR family transcriptional regulator [Breznakiella homolactica]
MAVIVREGLRDIVYKRLHEMIEDSRFVPGTRINVEQLTEEMGVSRTPIWQAIGKLEKEGLLVSVPNKGVFVKVLSPEESIDLYSVREVLECMAAELAAVHITGKTIDRMEKNLAEQREVIAAKDLVAYGRLDALFHESVYKASTNNYLIDILGDIQKKMRPMVMHMQDILNDLYTDHTILFNALKAGDPQAARESFRIHNERMKSLIRNVADSGSV